MATAIKNEQADACVPQDELPEGWSTTPLGDISTSIQYGYTASAVQGNGPRFLRITDIQNGTVDWSTVPTCNITKADAKKYGLYSGDILFARTGATTGKSFLIVTCPPAVFASYLIRVRVEEPLRPAFLASFFNTPRYWEFITENVAGNAQPNCNASKLGALAVPVAPGHEQARIVAKIDELLKHVNASREHLAKVPKILKAFRQSVLAAACSGRLTEDWRDNEPASRDSNQPELPASWSTQALSTLIESSFYGPRFPAESYSADGVPTIRTSDMAFDGSIDLQDAPRIKLSAEQIRRLSLHDGDLLITRTGATIGKCAVYSSSLGPAIPSAYLIRFRLYPERVYSQFLLLFLMSPSGQSLLVGGATAVAQPNVNARTVSEFPVALPPLQEQHEIVRRVEILFQLAEKIETRVQAATKRADRLTQAVLAKAFRGELVPTEAELARREGRDYEPASVLLDRIKAQRNGAASKKS